MFFVEELELCFQALDVAFFAFAEGALRGAILCSSPCFRGRNVRVFGVCLAVCLRVAVGFCECVEGLQVDGVPRLIWREDVGIDGRVETRLDTVEAEVVIYIRLRSWC